MNRSYPEGKRLLLRIGTVRVTLAVEREFNLPNERRRKSGQSEHARREGHAKPRAGHMKPSAAPAMLKRTPLACETNA
ncbi:MAG TPA: hypothetical protein VK530_02810, partial [Candidatus Acidoferrum sp.]|nr:hypothetical protein [Candidatus Acidoferrum sp.]